MYAIPVSLSSRTLKFFLDSYIVDVTLIKSLLAASCCSDLIVASTPPLLQLAPLTIYLEAAQVHWLPMVCCLLRCLRTHYMMARHAHNGLVCNIKKNEPVILHGVATFEGQLTPQQHAYVICSRCLLSRAFRFQMGETSPWLPRHSQETSLETASERRAAFMTRR